MGGLFRINPRPVGIDLPPCSCYYRKDTDPNRFHAASRLISKAANPIFVQSRARLVGTPERFAWVLPKGEGEVIPVIKGTALYFGANGV